MFSNTKMRVVKFPLEHFRFEGLWNNFKHLLTRSTMKTKPVLGNAILVLGVKPKWGWYVFWLFLMIGLSLAISFKRYRRELSIDVAEHRSMLENYQNTHYPRSSFTSKTDISLPKNGVFVFFCDRREMREFAQMPEKIYFFENLC